MEILSSSALSYLYLCGIPLVRSQDQVQHKGYAKDIRAFWGRQTWANSYFIPCSDTALIMYSKMPPVYELKPLESSSAVLSEWKKGLERR